jgi:hypothetical protein
MKLNLKQIKWVAIGTAVLLGAFFLLQKSCDLGEQVGKLKGELAEQKKIAAADKAISDGIILTQGGIIANQTKKINDLIAGANVPSPAIKEKDKTISALNDKLAAAKTDAEKVPILTSLVVQLSDKFTISEQRRKDELFSLNSAWQIKFDAQVEISSQWKHQYENEHILRLTTEALANKLETKLKLSKVLSTAKTVALIGAVGFIGYRAVKK